LSHPAPGAGASEDSGWFREARAALETQAAETPEWRDWIRMLEIATRAAADPAWGGLELRLAVARPSDAPVLEGARILVDPALVDALVTRLVAAASPPGSAPTGRRVDALRLLEAGVRQDRAALERAEPRASADPGLLAAVAHLASLPVLQEVARRVGPRVPAGWGGGYCPICGAWPALAEARGLERRRVLRCARCATGWERHLLLCPFCGERDHRRQGALTTGQDPDLVRIETCGTCRGYLKVVTTLRPRPAWAMPLDDLRTLDLELRALDQGLRRPERPGWPLIVAVSPAEAPAGGGWP
jgi:FdhE protein